MDNDDNVVSLVPQNNNGPSIPESDYVIINHQGEEMFATGFLLFTSHHVAVMRDTGNGALPILVVPLTAVAYAALVEDDDDDEEIFD